jgi:hypothetical protein
MVQRRSPSLSATRCERGVDPLHAGAWALVGGIGYRPKEDCNQKEKC